MPLGVKPICTVCKTVTSSMWRKGNVGEVLCNSCGLKQLMGVVPGKEPETATNNASNGKTGNGKDTAPGPTLRKSARIKPGKSKTQTYTKTFATKGKSRRVIFKKNPIKAPVAVSTVVTSDSVFYDGMYYQVGDIVSLLDHGGDVFYAQIRGFMQDQYTEKSAVITWLLPTQSTTKDSFDPSTYILGPEEELPRKMEYLEFVCHAPSDYFRPLSAPYRTLSTQPELSYVWAPIGPHIKPTPGTDEVFGVDSKTVKITLPTGCGKKYNKPAKLDR